LPGDISATERYYRHDLAKPEFTLEAGHIRVPESPGLGVEIDEDMLAAHTVNSKWLKPD
jgi:O-succinylbenzoate synthase